MVRKRVQLLEQRLDRESVVPGRMGQRFRRRPAAALADQLMPRQHLRCLRMRPQRLHNFHLRKKFSHVIILSHSRSYFHNLNLNLNVNLNELGSDLTTETQRAQRVKKIYRGWEKKTPDK
jgi:hypothetical protein